MLILLSYDLNGHERPSAYEDVKELIVQHSISYCRPLNSQWLIETDETLSTWQDRVKQVADSNDRWLIMEVSRRRTGWLAKSAWAWLNERT